MKVKFYCDNGANIHSERTEIFDVETQLGYTLEEWCEFDEDTKYEIVHEWAVQHFSYGYEELK